MENKKIVLKIENLSKIYKLGQIGRGTLTEDIQSWWARIRKKEDPTLKIGEAVISSNKPFHAIKDLNIECFEGEKIGIIGHNGAGKSTLLKLICSITTPSIGSIKYNGKISSMLEVGTGFVPEMTGRENIYLNGTILGMTIPEIDSKIEEIIEFSECREFIDTPVKRYSSGMFVKLAFSVASHLDNNIVIMDEVLAVGDAQFQQKCINKMTQIAQEDGKCVLFVSHNMQFIKQFCSRCIVMEKGEKIFDGDVDSAIDLYLDKNNSLNISYDFKGIPRARKYDKARLDEFSLIEKVDVIFDKDKNEKLNFNVKFRIKEETEKAYISILVKHIDETAVASIKSEFITDFTVNEIISKDFAFDLKNVVAGKYYLLVRIMKESEHNTPIILDEPLQNISFIVKSAAGERSWPRTLMGYTDLGILENI